MFRSQSDLVRLVVATMLVAAAAHVGAQSKLPLEFDTLGGTVNAIVQSGGSLYVGGNFLDSSAPTGHFAVVDDAGGAVLPGWPRVNGSVNAVTADGAGGWYIGGLITAVGGVPRGGVAHILADGRLSSWNPTVTGGKVLGIARHGSNVYLGGDFSTVAGLSRQGLAAVDAATGALDPWNPQANAGASVDDLELVGDVLYAAGTFSSFDGGASPRNRLAAFDLTSGALDLVWNPNADGRVRALRASGSTVYVGGAFLNVGGQARSRLAQLDAVGVGTGQGNATGWAPSVGNNDVYSISPLGTQVYVGGDFTSAGSPAATRNRLAAFDAATGALAPWNPNTGLGIVFVVEALPASVYAAGTFTSVAGSGRRGFARLDPATAVADAWNPSANAGGLTLFVDGSRVALGGAFEGLGARARGRLAAFDVATGRLNPWAPAADGLVNALAAFGGDVFVGGGFTTVTDGGGPHTRNRLARIDAAGTVHGGFVPDVNAAGVGVTDLLVSGTTPDVYVAGGFSSINGNASAARVGKLDGATGALDLAFLTPTPPAPGPGASEVSGLALAGGVLYLGGTFTTVGGQTRNHVAALDAVTGALDTSWNPDVDSTVNSLAAGTALFTGGSFAQVNGLALARNRMASFDPAVLASGTDLGTATGWDPDANATINDLAALANGRLALGGTFTTLNAGSALRNRLASVDSATGVAAPWNPDVNGAVNTVFATSTHVFAGGSFSAVGGKARENFAAFCLHEPPSLLTAAANGDNRIDLSWPAAGPGYRVYRGLSAGGPYEQIGTTTALSFSDTAADGGLIYRYVVRTDNGACLSDASTEATAATTGACNRAPEFEGAIAAAPGPAPACGARLTWRAATPFCGTGVRYSVYRSTSAVFVPDLSNRMATALPGTNYLDTCALSPATTYYYVVRASHDANGHEDGNLLRLRFDTPASCTQTAPEPVPVFTVTASGAQSVLDWLQPVIGYNQTMIRVCSASSAPPCASQYPQTPSDGALVTIQGGLPGTPDTFTHSGLNNGETYGYAAFADDGTGNYSTPRSSWGRPVAQTGPPKWGFASGASALTPVAVSPNNVYVAVSNDREVHAMRAGAAGGNWPAAWTPLAMNAPAQGRPTLVSLPVGAASRVSFVGSQDGRVYAVDADTGASLWTSVVLGEGIQAPPSVMATALGGAYNLVFAATRNVSSANRVYALNLADGTVAWSFDNGGSGNAALAIGIIGGQPLVEYGANRLFFASRQRGGGSLNTIWALSFNGTGASVLWARDVGDVDGAVTRVGSRVYVGTNAGRVYALEIADGSLPWIPFFYRVPGGVPIQALVNPVQVGPALRLFVASNGRLFSIDDIGNDFVRYWPAAGVVVPGASPPTVRAPWIYVGGSNSQLYAVNGNDPNPTPLQVTIGDPLVPKQVGRPTIDTGQQLLLVGTDQGAIHAVALFP